jgi:long-chain acyl-CoA synthetase
VLLYSSGTTGLPKGIPLKNRNVVGGVKNAEAGGYFRRHEELFAYLPTAWVGDFIFTLGAGVMLVATINIPERAGNGACTICARCRRPSISPRRAPGTRC